MRVLADYVLRTRTDEVPVSPPVREGGSSRVTMGFAAPDANLVRHLAGQEAVLVTNIQRPGEALARLRLVAVDPVSSRLVAEVVGTPPPEPVRPEPAPRASVAQPRRPGKAGLAAGAVLGLLVLVAVGLTVYARTDRKCTSSSDCPDGLACVSWGTPPASPALELVEYRSCERECQSDRDCPGREQCFLVDDGPRSVRVCRSPR